MMKAELYYNRYASGDLNVVSKAVDSAKTIYIDDVPTVRREYLNTDLGNNQTVTLVFDDGSSLKMSGLGESGTFVSWGVFGVEQK